MRKLTLLSKITSSTCLALLVLSSGTLSATVPEFSDHLIKSGYSYAYGVAAADLNGDGTIDLTSANVLGASQTSDLYWFENDGFGNFQEHIVYQGEPGWLERHAIGDLDSNGFQDVVIAQNKDGKVLWYSNDGQPAAGPWARHVVTSLTPRAYDVALADFDGDLRLDVAVAGYASNQISWFSNPGPSGWSNEWNKILIDTTMSEARTIRAGDFNGDGKIDIMAAAAGATNIPVPAPPASHNSQVVWYENTGSPATWVKHTIDNQSRAPIHGEPIDMDGDGSLDVVMAFGLRSELVPAEYHEVAWYDNIDGTGLSWNKYTIGALPYAFEAAGSDFDRDGDLDVVASAWAYGDKVVWFENHGDPRSDWTMHTVKSPWNAANQVVARDLNGDGWTDIVATADDGSSRVVGARELRWWENQGQPRPTALASSAFNHQYNGDVYSAANAPATIPNYTLSSSGFATAPTTDGDILTFRLPAGGPYFAASNWSVDHETGFTIEFRIKIDNDFAESSKGAFAVYFGDGVAGDVLSVGKNSVWAGVGALQIDSGDNTDGFHTFRISQAGGTPTPIHFYRDGVLIHSWTNGGNWATNVLYWGSGGSAFGGPRIHLDYFRWDNTGAYEPLPAIPGDFDGDGDVDGADFVAWQTHFPTATGATLADGDADSDGDVDGADFVVWQTHFPYTPSPSHSIVPEPASWSLTATMIGVFVLSHGSLKSHA